MRVARAEPGELVHRCQRRGALARAERLAAAEGERLHAAAPVIQHRLHAHAPGRELEVRLGEIACFADAERRLAQDADAEVPAVPRLRTPAPVATFATHRGELGDDRAGRALAVPRTVERHIERVAR